MRTMNYALGLLKLEKGMQTDAEVAEYLGIKTAAFSNYKNGQRRMPDTAIALICEATGISMRDMIAIANMTQKSLPPEEATFWSNRMSDEILEIGSRPALASITNQNLRPAGWRKRRDSNPR